MKKEIIYLLVGLIIGALLTIVFLQTRQDGNNLFYTVPKYDGGTIKIDGGKSNNPYAIDGGKSYDPYAIDGGKSYKGKSYKY